MRLTSKWQILKTLETCFQFQDKWCHKTSNTHNSAEVQSKLDMQPHFLVDFVNVVSSLQFENNLNVLKTWKCFKHFCPIFFDMSKNNYILGIQLIFDSFQELSNGNALDNVRVSPLYFHTLLYHLGNMCLGHVMPLINSSSFILSCPTLWLQGQAMVMT